MSYIKTIKGIFLSGDLGGLERRYTITLYQRLLHDTSQNHSTSKPAHIFTVDHLKIPQYFSCD